MLSAVVDMLSAAQCMLPAVIDMLSAVRYAASGDFDQESFLEGSI
ncbi:hypothetical protein HMPREF9538_02534 [Klebsiella sp. MS 92-3]|jgi:hypothetical protein|nr:hypothetical protein HMPREF9538_02534 [Klebsiella sp. MS 92-3]